MNSSAKNPRPNRLKHILLGALLCHNPIGALLVEGRVANELDRPDEPWIWPPRAAWGNLKTGFQLFVATSLALFPALYIMHSAWVAGWTISFFKNYEFSEFGRGSSLIGSLIFMVTMLYVPMAQAHQIHLRRFSAFFEVSQVARLVLASPWRNLWVAMLFALATLPFVASRMAFTLLGNGLMEMPEGARTLAAHGMVFVTCAIGYLLFSRLRRALRALRAEAEKKAGSPVHILSVTPALVLTLIVWFPVVASIYFSNFINYIPVRGFLIQPLLQLPWFNWLP